MYISHAPTIKLFSMHLGSDDMVCSDKCFFMFSTKQGNSSRFPLALLLMMCIAPLLIVMGDFHLPFIA
jgi:predicted nucleic acid-binding Zn ribbon protein